MYTVEMITVFTREDTLFIPIVYLEIPIPAMTPVKVTVNGVELLLSNLDSSKARGPDGLPIRFLKEMNILCIVRVNDYTYSFFPQAIKLWNSLPRHLISSPDFETFKESLHNLH